MGTFIPDRSIFCPGREQIGKGDDPDKVSCQGFAAMGDGIGVKESWF